MRRAASALSLARRGGRFREAIRLDPQNNEARGRLRAIGQQP